MPREKIIEALRKFMRPEQFKKTIDANWPSKHLESLLDYYTSTHE